MKRLVIGGVLLVGIVLGAVVYVQAPKEIIAQDNPPSVTTDLTELIDDIAVPSRILLDAQMEHPGFAVTGAEKVNRDGADRYRLKIENSDTSSGQENLYLLYDMDWDLMGEEKSAPLPVLEIPDFPELPDMTELEARLRSWLDENRDNNGRGNGNSDNSRPRRGRGND